MAHGARRDARSAPKSPRARWGTAQPSVSPWLYGAEAAADYLGWPIARVHNRARELPHYHSRQSVARGPLSRNVRLRLSAVIFSSVDFHLRPCVGVKPGGGRPSGVPNRACSHHVRFRQGLTEPPLPIEASGIAALRSE